MKRREFITAMALTAACAGVYVPDREVINTPVWTSDEPPKPAGDVLKAENYIVGRGTLYFSKLDSEGQLIKFHNYRVGEEEWR
jgi:hypothetical protein